MKSGTGVTGRGPSDQEYVILTRLVAGGAVAIHHQESLSGQRVRIGREEDRPAVGERAHVGREPGVEDRLAGVAQRSGRVELIVADGVGQVDLVDSPVEKCGVRILFRHIEQRSIAFYQDFLFSQADSMRGSIFRRDSYAQAVELGDDLQLTGQAGAIGLLVGAVEQIVLVLALPLQPVVEAGLDIDVAGRARAAAAAQSEQFVEAVLTDYFHHREAGFAFDLGFSAVARRNDDLDHGLSFRR
jgi:hypothetical protein